MSKVIKDKIRIYVRYRLFDDEGVEIEKKRRWLGASNKGRGRDRKIKWEYRKEYYRGSAHEWVNRYGDRAKAIDMARKLAQIVKVGRDLLERGYVYDLVMVREVTKRTVVSLTDNPMVVIAVAAMGD